MIRVWKTLSVGSVVGGILGTTRLRALTHGTCIRRNARYYKGMEPKQRVRRVVLTFSCPPDMAAKIDALVRETGRSGSEIVRAAVAAYLMGAAQ